MMVAWKGFTRILMGALALMSLRIQTAKTPEDRLAAVAVEVMIRMQKNHGRLPDYADFAKEFRPYLDKIRVQAQLDENEIALRLELSKRREDLLRHQKAIKFSDDF